VSLFESHGILPRDARELTLYQFRCLLRGAEETDKASRYARMTPEVRRTADKINAKHGTF